MLLVGDYHNGWPPIVKYFTNGDLPLQIGSSPQS
jgi:hypothetical protein